ncbi:MAG: PLP-dependent aminotransferase family protein [Bryobacteraceae bacterium]
MDFTPQLRHDSDIPLYRQIFLHISAQIRSGDLLSGERLPATRELAGLLGLNRATISAAYEMLETEGLIAGHVGRGSFVTGTAGRSSAAGLDWSSLLDRPDPGAGQGNAAGRDTLPRQTISFATSRPSRDLFPLDEFRTTCAAVLDRADLADILQLGSPGGYEPLRRYLLDDARRQGLAGPNDDVLITNGCQQALDLIGRVLLSHGDTVAVEDPIYPGLKNLLADLGAQLAGIPVSAEGLEVPALVRILQRERPRLLVVTPNFQNPTGATLPLAARHALLDAARAARVPVVENDPYVDLRYEGQPVAPLKALDRGDGTVLLRSFSKISFPGLRVGWVVGPKLLVDRLRQAKEAADLHSDQLSQAVLLEFAESGRLAAHLARVLEAGRDRLRATLAACRDLLPPGARWTTPEGGMNLWLRLPEPLDAAALLGRAQKEGVSFLPSRYFAVSRQDPGGLRLSFAGLAPPEIRAGLSILARIVSAELAATLRGDEPVPAMV